MPAPQHRDIKNAAKSFLGELVVYGGLVTAYCLLVLRYLSGWLGGLFQHERRTYAAVALALIVAQGAVLEKVTSFLLRVVRRARHRAP